MKKVNYILWYFPLCFFVFLALFMFIKFIFIFFFNAAYEPEFMFDLTPYYALTGVNNLQLLLLSLIIVAFDVYLHVKLSKKNLLLSFIPTGVMLAGLGLKIATTETTISSILHFIVFGSLLVIALIDHKHSLMFFEVIVTPKKEQIIPKIPRRRPVIDKAQAPPVYVSEKPAGFVSADEILTLHKETLAELRSMLKDDLRRAETLMQELERKTKKIDRLEEEIERRNRVAMEQEGAFKCPYTSTFDRNLQVKSFRSQDEPTFDSRIVEKSPEPDTALDNILGCAAILKRGILKKVNRPFIDLLGYEMDILLGKSLFDFVDPEGLLELEYYYFNRLKGQDVSTCKTSFLTGDNKKIRVEIAMKPAIYGGERADMALVRTLD